MLLEIAKRLELEHVIYGKYGSREFTLDNDTL